MYYRQLAEVSAYVNESARQIQEILQLLCLKALAPIHTDALLYLELDKTGVANLHSAFGIEIQDSSRDQAKFGIAERTPFTDSIRENRTIWINSLPQWPKPYTNMGKLELPKGFKTMISSPIDVDGLPIGSLTAFSHTKIEFDEITAEYIEALAIILATALRKPRIITYPSSEEISRTPINGKLNGSNQINHKSPNGQTTYLCNAEINEPLSERQNLILKLISEGRTNSAIADVLGYSESLIRQETIKIYAKLGCSGRNEAALIYSKSLQPNSVLAI